MRLLERESALAQLGSQFDRAASGRGSCALVFGEAGVGKSALIRQFLSSLPPGTPQLVAGCEALFAPRPMGPFVDLADHWPPRVAQSLREGRMYPGLHAEMLTHLSRAPSPKVLVLEDLHWADAGTLDVVRYLGRRVAGSGTLIVMSFRSDDVATDHPLRSTLGDLPSGDTERINVRCLSRDAVNLLARCAGRSASGLFEATGGNAFFVTEVLSGQPGSVPHSVQDAVLARLLRLSPSARAVAELVSVAPTAMERSLLEHLEDDAAALIDECVDKHMLREDDTRIGFRHELARLAVMQALAPSRSMLLHRLVFGALRQGQNPDANLQRRVHHAAHAGLSREVLTMAPRAAAAASAMSAHREAAGLYAHAIKHAGGLGAAARAELFESAAKEFRFVGASADCMQATQQALALRRQAGDMRLVGMNLCRLAVGHWGWFGRRREAQAAITEAVACLESVPDSIDLAVTYAELSRMQSAWSEFGASITSGDRALALAESLNDPRCLVQALHAAAAARMFVSDDKTARAHLQRALAMALELGLEDAAAPLYCTLQMVSLIYRHHAFALDVAEQGIAYCEARDLDMHLPHLLDNRALSQIELGRWAEAETTLARCVGLPGLNDRLQNSLQFLVARQAARRGDESVRSYWQTLCAAPDSIALGYRLPAVAAACTEAAWLSGEFDAATRLATLGAQAALARADARLLGPLLVWLHRLGAPLPAHTLHIAPEHASELAGRVAEAASLWAAHACVHERALALLHGDEAQVREAFEVLTTLGAVPAAEIARARLRAMGARGVQRGPQPRTRDDPDGLTPSERKVHELLCLGLSNAAIASRLHRSERTVECHVANTLAKLGLRSRTELRVRTPHVRSEQSTPT